MEVIYLSVYLSMHVHASQVKADLNDLKQYYCIAEQQTIFLLIQNMLKIHLPSVCQMRAQQDSHHKDVLNIRGYTVAVVIATKTNPP